MGGLGATYTVQAHFKARSGLPISELFSLGAMVQALRANIDWKSPFLKGVGRFGPRMGRPHQPFVHG